MRKRPLLWWLLTILAGITILAVIVLAIFPQKLLTVDSGEVQGDAIVVLEGAPDLRAERAAELFRQGDAPRIVVSGVDDIQAFTLRLEKNGVPQDIITQEPHSSSTLENARFSVAILRQMGARRVIIVTSWYHSRRALACFRHVAPDISFYSRPSYFGYAPKEWGRDDVGLHIAIEYLKILRYWIGYGISPFSQ